MKTFLICPVRGHDPKKLESLLLDLEKKYVVHFPPRDTNQIDETGYRICTDNLNAIRDADIVLIVWDGKSQGGLFDAGMAFALGKKIEIISIPELTEGKSFQNMFTEWEKK